jgi:ubiquinol-cytochrome c reductase cytochrome c subunit
LEAFGMSAAESRQPQRLRCNPWVGAGVASQGGVAGPRLGPGPLPLPAILKYVRQPTGQMPPYTSKVISDAELADIYAFLQSLPQPPRPESIPALK